MDLAIAIILIVVALVLGIVAGFFAGVTYRKRVAEKAISSAEEEAKRLVAEAAKTADAKKRESLVEAKEEIHRNRVEFDRELKERRQELSKQERRLQQKEEQLDKKHDTLDQKNETLADKLKEAENVRDEAERLKAIQLKRLEEISSFTAEQAKNEIISGVETEIIHEKATKIRELEAQFKDESDEKAREIISLAIQKCASDHVSEATVSVVPLPNDEMKGRIIGREGRNIRTLETLTGVDLIIDDTPEAITLSCFDPVRREVARVALEKLIADGRIHPARIEEMVEKAKKSVDATIKAEGEAACLETRVHGIHPELIKILGRLRFRTSYGQNVLRHSIEVAQIAGIMAAELGVDVTLAKRAGLLHDIGKSIDRETEGSHVTIGVTLAKKYKENNDVIHAIEAHHGDVDCKTIIACLVQAADAVSAARPGARRENLENYIKRLQKLEEIANSFLGVDKSFAIQAGREIRIMVKPEEINDDKMILLARDLSQKIEQDLDYPGQIKVHLIRETRHIDYAK